MDNKIVKWKLKKQLDNYIASKYLFTDNLLISKEKMDGFLVDKCRGGTIFTNYSKLTSPVIGKADILLFLM